MTTTFPILWPDQMHGIASACLVPSRVTVPYSRQTDVCVMQNVCRNMQSNTVHAFRRRTRHSRNVVYHRIGKGVRKRLSIASNPRSMALSAKVRYAVQRIHRHVCQNQVGSKRLSEKLRHRRTKASLRGRHFGTSRHSIGSRQDRLQSGITCVGQTHVEFVLG